MARSNTQDPNHTTLSGEHLLDEYVLNHSDQEPEYLYRLWRDTNVRLLHGRMASGRLQGRLLKMLTQMLRPQNIIEVGTFSGYSALCMAEGLASLHKQWGGVEASHEESSSLALHEEASSLALHQEASSLALHQEASSLAPHLYTFEINDEQEPFTRPWIEQSPWAEYVTFLIGDASIEARKLGVKFDMAFLDGDKRTYVETYEALLPLMRPGGFMLADNTLWDGHVTDAAYDRDQQTCGIRRFNDHVAADGRVSRVMLPLRDGLTIIRVND